MKVRRPRANLRSELLGVRLWVWTIALAVGVIMMGPALGPGALLNLDLLAFDNADLPRGTWGLGPELPRRVPLGTLLAPLNTVFGGETVTKVLLVVIIVAAFVGAFRLTRSAMEQSSPTAGGDPFDRTLLCLGGAMLWATGPFLMTRLAVGHWQISLATAALPWVLPMLIESIRSTRSVFLGSAVMAVCGPYGAMLSGGYLLATFLRRGSSDSTSASRLRCASVWLGAQSVWLVPSAFVLLGAEGRRLADSSAFPTDASGPLDVIRLAIGTGFWNPPFQVNADGRVLSAVLAIVLLLLAVIGIRVVPRSWRLPLLVPAVASLVLALASCTPGIESVFSRFTSTPLGNLVREPQRFLPPLLLWITLAATVGAMRICERLRTTTDNDGKDRRRAGVAGSLAATPLVVALLLAAPAIWGLGGQLRPVHLPTEWAEARSAIKDSPGTVLALPWFAYFTADIADNRLIQNPLSSYFDGEVIRSSDLRISPEPSPENADPRESAAASIVERLRSGEAQSGALAALGVRWVAIDHDVDWLSYSGLRVDPGLEVIVEGPTLTLYRVNGVGNGTVDQSGRTDVAQPHLLPLWTASTTAPITLPIPYQFGWMRGLSPGTSGDFGSLTFRAGNGPIWFWPALVVLAVDIVWLAAVILAIRRRGSTTPQKAEQERSAGG
jgi:hypothetical protein